MFHDTKKKKCTLLVAFPGLRFCSISAFLVFGCYSYHTLLLKDTWASINGLNYKGANSQKLFSIHTPVTITTFTIKKNQFLRLLCAPASAFFYCFLNSVPLNGLRFAEYIKFWTTTKILTLHYDWKGSCSASIDHG